MIAIRNKIYNRSIEKADVNYYNSMQNSYLHNLFQFKVNMENLFIENHMEIIRDYIDRDKTNSRSFRK
jgi:hypothetical protein